jgi:FtsP/CotA-like multicopper oxidase with cupredoxin domain
LCWVYVEPVNGKLTQLSIPPTLNVKQGETLSITLRDALPPPGNVQTPPPLYIDRESGATNMGMNAKPDPYALMCNQPQLAPTPTPDPVTGRVYGYHRSPWNEANLHFHGLNTSPNQPSDDVMNVLICPVLQNTNVGSYHYVVNIPRNEPPGLYWYHPHAHGESLYQVFMGLTGAIIVHSIKPGIPDLLPSHLVIVRDTPAHPGIIRYPRTPAMNTHPSEIAANRTLPARSMWMPTTGEMPFKRNSGPDPFQSPDHCPGPKIPFNTTSLTVNGIPLPISGTQVRGLPVTTIGLGERQYWRLANTDAQTTLDLVLLVNGVRQPFMVTARDGVPLIVENGKPPYQPVSMDHIFLPPASRIEFYLLGQVAGADMVVRTLQVDTGCVGDVDLTRNLFHVRVGTDHVAQNVVVPPSTDPVPQRFSNLGWQTPAKQRTFLFTEYIRPDEPEPDFYLTETSNPTAVEHPYRMSGPPDTVVKDGTVEQWTFYNYTNEVHAFHIHQIHFMPIFGVTKEEGLGQLVDTVFIPHGGYNAQGKFIPRKVVVLMDFRERNIIGTFVYHCHFLEHEDNGMMARIRVVP